MCIYMTLISKGITEASSGVQLVLNTILCLASGQMCINKQQATSLSLQQGEWNR